MKTQSIKYLLLLALVALLSACGFADDSNAAKPNKPELGLIALKTFIKGQSITPFLVSNTGGSVDEWSISPALPSGLVFDNNGRISGTPQNTQAIATYTILAKNDGGQSTASLSFRVNLAKPVISGATKLMFKQGQAVANANYISTGGEVDTWSISPTLPQGLSLNPNTGEVFGTPSGLLSLATYTISAFNSAGDDSTKVAIVVQVVIPDLVNPAAQTYIRNVSISPTIITNNGGAVTNWSVSPALPSGLSLDQTGQISGTPDVNSSNTPYHIIGRNASGVDTAIAIIRVIEPTPVISGLSKLTLKKDQAMPYANYISTAGIVDTWLISPTLPAGLIFSFDNRQATISGTPTTIQTSSRYIISAGNTTGTNTFAVVLSVDKGKPNLADIGQKTYTKDIAITAFTPINTGSSSTDWRVSPNLPQGLSLNPNTGEVFGTPSGVLSLVTYTISAFNSAGDDSTSVAIVVQDILPDLVNLAAQTYTRNISISATRVVNNGGAVTSWSVSPTLPSGLSLDQTGRIFGIPYVSRASTAYNIIGRNASGFDTAITTIKVIEPAPFINNLGIQNYSLNTQIIPFKFNNIGGIANSWSISPALPNGLVLDQTTGFISGTPASQPIAIQSIAITYTMTASNTAGSDTATIELSISSNLPSVADIGLQSLVVNKAINNIVFINTGARFATWTIKPDLPTGLSLSNTGVITGTPTILSQQTDYEVTITNADGYDKAKISILVDNPSPTISGPSNKVLAKDIGINPINFSNTGGYAKTWSISPNLPTGLLFNTRTGQIYGTPTITSSATIYTVVAGNSSGSGQTDIILSVIIDNNRKISGQISIAPLIVSDSDLNDPSATYKHNDFLGTAQVIENYVKVHGFVNYKLSSYYGIPGRFSQRNDQRDYYKVSLKKGQIIELTISNYAGYPKYPNYLGRQFDLDLLLFNKDYRLVDYSEKTTAKEKVVVPRDGTYYILVYAFYGMSKYVLSLSGYPDITAQNNDVNFIPYQAIVQTKDNPSGVINPLAQDNLELKRFPYGTPSERIALAGAQSAFLGELASKNLDSYDKYQTLKAIKLLGQSAGVVSAGVNSVHHSLQVPNDTYYSRQWDYPAMSLPDAWDITTGLNPARDTIVAVVDTGVYLNHPDLKNKIIAGYDFISNPYRSNDGDGIDADADDVGDGYIIESSSWHGTHVAGTIAAESNNNKGIAGVSWGAKIMPIRVLGKGGGTGYDVLQGVLYAAGLPNDSGTVPAKKADIINLSLGGGSFSQATQDVYSRVINNNVIVIAAAGNSNSGQLFYPASYDGVVSVSAIDYANKKAPYSNFGAKIDVAAPGGNSRIDLNRDGFIDGILSTVVNAYGGQRNESYKYYQGTSMAAPHVAGVAALMRALYPELSPTQFNDLLILGRITTEAGATGRDDIYGHGIINALKAVNEAQALANGGSVPILPANIKISPEIFNMAYDSKATLTIINIGGVSATVNSVVVSPSAAGWLSVVGGKLDVRKLGDYLLSIDRTGLTDGDHTGNITFNLTDANGRVITKGATIIIRSGAVVQGNSVSSLYAMLQDTQFNIIQVVTPTKVQLGLYSYQFNNVAPGDYRVIAGSDLDNDKKYCQSGETCGAYPVLNSIQNITISRDNITDIDFLINIISSGIGANIYK